MSTSTLATFDVANAHFVTNFLAVGGDLDMNDDELAVRQARELADAGITHVLDARFEAEEDLWSEVSGVTYTRLGIDDAGQRIDWSWFDDVARWADASLAVADAKLLTHCHMGINRGPTAGLVVLLASGWDPIEALDAIRSARPIAAIGYSGQAIEWHLQRTGASRPEFLAMVERYAEWQDSHPLDVVRIIAEQRQRGV